MKYLDESGQLIPWSPFSPSLVEDPVTALARQMPSTAASVLLAEISQRKVATRVDGLQSISHDHAAMACTWLHNRHGSERNMEIESFGQSIERGWFGSGERVGLVTRIRIS
ncbi:MAG: hypothetical protein A3J62_00840 [Candidatus Buchananbacteria bacterium RIFCSPHIGHO2_02_FULL_38_8]|uniref:Uncharacterized protein n=2 Tax=Candidatus Buchananiibacteriota TaxID=1817903 RepID=A0A1G1XX37_9BACT|nr:MAG: hypothetical protein A2731_00905 [Candidatus Buchananbacteria bacterium RIFCSPHIGHO2_01_FULL_39_8]OGY47742.1 MAG: hypothetical protein A3J62_00840 [Candidatus Buchananbacteria bacterium RIFCSPHIGHO2_02_FULL_38_8]